MPSYCLSEPESPTYLRAVIIPGSSFCVREEDAKYKIFSKLKVPESDGLQATHFRLFQRFAKDQKTTTVRFSKTFEAEIRTKVVYPIIVPWYFRNNGKNQDSVYVLAPGLEPRCSPDDPFSEVICKLEGKEYGPAYSVDITQEEVLRFELHPRRLEGMGDLEEDMQAFTRILNEEEKNLENTTND